PRLGDSIYRLSFHDGLTLSQTGETLKIIHFARKLIESLGVTTAFKYVAGVEAQLGGRYVDDAVLYLALDLAVQKRRVKQKQFLSIDQETVTWLRGLQVWAAAASVAQQLLPETPPEML